MADTLAQTLPADRLRPLREAVRSLTRLADGQASEAVFLTEGREILAQLISHDDWLEEDFRRTHPEYYQQYLLYCDPHERFSLQSFVWGPGQSTPIHDHTVWGLVGVLQGAESCMRYRQTAEGLMPEGEALILARGSVDAVSPTVGDIHKVSNAFSDRTSISIHIYGANIGNTRRHVFDVTTGAQKDFVSGYSFNRLPNLWDQSAVIRAQAHQGASASA